ncbi:hypothetical protein V6N13_125447 [Hibiscus sabdariffa]
MDVKSNPVLTDPAPLSKSSLQVPSDLLQYSRAAFSPSLFLTVSRMEAGIIDICTSNCLDSMESSSPPHKVSRDFSNDHVSADTNVAYHTWLLKYPSALSSFEQITNFAEGKRIALFLDYDGTLSPIVDDPETNRAQLCGSHGMDIMSAVRQSSDDYSNYIQSTDKQGKEVDLFQPASEFLPMIDEVFNSLVNSTEEIQGAKVENNKFCLSVHYRNVDEKDWATVAQRVHDVIRNYPRLRLTHGRKVLEVRPVIDWDKGKAVTYLLESLGLGNCDDVLPIYVGDDQTDEDAFKVLREGNRGYGILVSSVPKESNAFFSLKDPQEVMEFLTSLVVWKKKSET